MEVDRKRAHYCTWVIGSEPQDNMPIRSHHDGIPPHGEFRESHIIGIHARFILASHNSLENVAV